MESHPFATFVNASLLAKSLLISRFNLHLGCFVSKKSLHRPSTYFSAPWRSIAVKILRKQSCELEGGVAALMPALMRHPLLLSMHANPFGFDSTGSRSFIERGEISFKLSTGKKFAHNAFDMPSEDVAIEPHAHDVLMGRGGKNNQHSGNEKLRELARVQARKYSSSTKKGKSNLSRILVKQMRDLDPPARFLKKDQTSGIWQEVGDDTAREKASQVLRDAVALLSEGTAAQSAERQAPEADEVSSSAASVPVSSPDDATPALASLASTRSASSAFSSNDSPRDRGKRRRYNFRSTTMSNPYYSYAVPHDTPSASTPQRDSRHVQFAEYPYIDLPYPTPHHRAYHHHPGAEYPVMPVSAHPLRRSARQPIQPSPLQRRRPDPASGVRGYDAQDQQDPSISEFDLFHGELLESDHDDDPSQSLHSTDDPF